MLGADPPDDDVNVTDWETDCENGSVRNYSVDCRTTCDPMVEHNVCNMFVIVILTGFGFYAAHEGDIPDSLIRKSLGYFKGIMAVLNHEYGTEAIR